jgi:Glu-tRNA(Gln) amidotransferase subunit E-like FAD-binding protein
VEDAREALPVPPRKRERRYLELGVSRHLTYPLALSARAPAFERATEAGCDPKLAARVLVEELLALRRAGWEVDQIGNGKLVALLIALRDERLYREGVPAVLEELVRQGSAKDLSALLSDMEMTPLDRSGVISKARATIQAAPRPATSDPEARLRYYMGETMRKLRGRARGKLVRQVVADILAEQAVRPQ